MLDGIRDIEEIRTRKDVSLNIDTRRKELEEATGKRLERENVRRTALHLEPVESLDDLDGEEMPDVNLDQAAAIVTDLAELRQIALQPAQTAQIHPGPAE